MRRYVFGLLALAHVKAGSEAYRGSEVLLTIGALPLQWMPRPDWEAASASVGGRTGAVTIAQRGRRSGKSGKAFRRT